MFRFKNNNEIFLFLEKCNLKEKDYVWKLHKTDNGFTKIDSEKFDDFVQNNKIISTNIYYTNSIFYLYSETYIEYIDRNGKNQGENIYGIKNFSQGKIYFNFFVFLFLLLEWYYYISLKRKKMMFIWVK